MNSMRVLLKSFFTAKNIADASLSLAMLLGLSGHLWLLWYGKELGFLELLAVLAYGGISILGLSVLSLLTRAVWLYRNPQARTWQQKGLLFLTALPGLGLILDAWGFY